MLVGPSGCGKTTAMRMVNRMIDITDGDILLDGRSVKERQPAELRRDIGYAIQQIGLFPHLSVADNIATVPRLLGWDKARIRARVDELLELVSLDPHETRDRFPAQLSGGQRQRVGVARALAVDPPLMLMDEPFGAIDPINRERLQNEFLRLQREIRKTIVFVTHDIDEAIKMGDRIAVLQKGGKLAQYAPPAELLMYPDGQVRRGLRGRRPRAQAARPAARARRRPLEGAARAGRASPWPRRAPSRSTARCPIPCSIDDGRPAARLAVGEGARRASAWRRSCARRPSRCSSSTTSCATRSPTCSRRRPSTGPWSTSAARSAGVLSIEILAHALRTDPEEVPSGADAAA